MGRELNKDLFDELVPTAPLAPQRPSLGSGPWAPPPAPPFLKEEDWKVLVSQVEQIKRRQKEQEAQLDTLNNRITEVISGIKVRFERLTGATQRLEDFFKTSIQEIHSKFASLSSRVAERKLSDAKVQEMIERHMSLVQQFDLRMNQVQKLVAEQELQLMNAKAALRETQKEIIRLRGPDASSRQKL